MQAFLTFGFAASLDSFKSFSVSILAQEKYSWQTPTTLGPISYHWFNIEI